MYRLDKLCVTEMTVEHMIRPLGNDCILPRFGWKIQCDARNVRQTAYRLVISSEAEIVADTGKILSDQRIEVTVAGLKPEPMTRYQAALTVWDNQGHAASSETVFETGRMCVPFTGSSGGAAWYGGNQGRKRQVPLDPQNRWVNDQSFTLSTGCSCWKREGTL